ncbi:hypothetical protein AH782_09660 [Salmonella enterica subsp. enterica]|nr:hypothetical protein [Salmonella enterica subsp. enterica serovar Rubislaw]EDK1585464.1 hypothetical protein [Salmonella enterica subsp. enterica serovar Rubislaw]
MKLNNPDLIEILEAAINQRAIVQMNDAFATVTFYYQPHLNDLSVVYYIGYIGGEIFDNPFHIWRSEMRRDNLISIDEFKQVIADYSYYVGG